MPAHKRLAAAAALAAASLAVLVAADQAVSSFPRGAAVLVGVAAALGLAVHALTRRRARRVAGLVGAGVVLALAVALLVRRDSGAMVVVVAASAIAIAAARIAFRARVELPPAPRPARPVLFYNPRAGGGKAQRFALDAEARARGIKPVELRPGRDLETLVREEIARGADALAMAGGDGSQAIVAAIAAERGLPYACVPAGTRNHFALDLGVDRDDVVGALDAFVDGVERIVDLAEVDGRVFVNNVSFGLYGTAVQRDGYRDAKLRTLLDTVPDVAGPVPEPPAVRWRAPDGDQHQGGLAMLVSNNRYRLGSVVGAGTRPRLDGAELGIVVVGERGASARPRLGWSEWTTPSLEVESDRSGPIAVGIDGEAVRLSPPLRFRVRPGALRVMIARKHPGASPSARRPAGVWASLRALGRMAFRGRA